MDGSFVLVNTVTGEVSRERQIIGQSRDTWNCLDSCRERYGNCLDNCREDWPGEPWCYEHCDESRVECDDGCWW